MPDEHLHGFFGERHQPAGSPGKVRDQGADVFAAIPKRRNFEMNDSQAIHQILAELARGNQFRQVSVRRSDNADVNTRAVPIGAHGLDLARLEEPKQHRLHPQAHFPYFIEKNGPAMGRLQLAHLVPVRPGKTAFDVSKQL
jgi:hypothetical protein